MTSLDALHRAVTEFAVTDPGLVIEPPARAAARRSLDSAGLLLLGEVHGVRENPSRRDETPVHRMVAAQPGWPCFSRYRWWYSSAR